MKQNKTKHQEVNIRNKAFYAKKVNLENLKEKKSVSTTKIKCNQNKTKIFIK